MPVYRTKESYLRGAIESILNQTFSDFEFLILDDCPYDNREEIVKSYHDPRIKYLKNDKNLGITPSRNKLIDLAEGEYLAVMDHDDISLPTRFEKQVAYLDAHKNVGVVGCLAEQFPEYAFFYYPETDEDIKARLTCYNGILHPASMIRKSVLNDYNIRYEEEYSPAEDQALWAALMEYTDFYNIQEVLFNYRSHQHNTTHRQMNQIIYAAEAVHCRVCQRHPELMCRFICNLEVWKVYYIFKKIPLFSLVKRKKKVLFRLFAKIPVFCFSIKSFLMKELKNHINLVQLLKNDTSEDKSRFDVMRMMLDIFSYRQECSATEVWFCHSRGGGADVYFKGVVEAGKHSVLYIEVQDFDIKDTLKISYFYKEYSDFFICDYKNAEFFLNKIMPQKIVVNNLAFYFSLEKVLNQIQRLKQNCNCCVSFRGHDFQAICPNIHMQNSKDEYCNCFDFRGCKSCIKKIKKPLMKIRSISKYKGLWQKFLYDVVDEVVLFSQSTAEIYKKFYPLLENKIKIIPHTIKPLRKINIQKHPEINIAVLGNLNVVKGLNVIKEMDSLITQNQNVKIVLIGQTKEKFENIRVLGRYERKNLPEIMEKNNIDIVFIASIIPETFSYTTAETISMGLPVACFNLGAQAEFVKQYSHGLIIGRNEAKYALDEIVRFVKIKRKR